MRAVLRLLSAAAVVAGVCTGAGAGTIVEFPGATPQGPALRGYLARPDTGLSAYLAGQPEAAAARYPAVVVLHGCSGFSGHSASIADRLASWGYVALAVDSLGPRGIPTACGAIGLPDQAFDAYAALRYLARLDFVDPARIGVLGQSMGGSSILRALQGDDIARHFAERFRAAVAYYPGCRVADANLTAPTLILIGEADDWTWADFCQAMVEHARPGSAPIAITVYPGATHAFDVAEFDRAVSAYGHRLEYNGPAAKDAAQKTRAFLAAHLGQGASGRPAHE